jgi:hypothetical protein
MTRIEDNRELALRDNSLEKVKFREDVLTVQDGLLQMIEAGAVQSTMDDCTLTHYFTPKDEKYGCCTYAREMLIPKGTVIIGKIHRHKHLNFITKGKVIVFTEFGQKHLEAPCTFISEVGLKRAVYAEEDTLWTTVHLTEFTEEAQLDKIENEVIAPAYADMGLIASTQELLQLESEGASP